MFTKILCPTDFSDAAKHALAVAVRLATAGDAELVIASSWYMPPLAYAGEQAVPAPVLETMMQSSERLLAEAAREVERLGVKRVSTRFLTGLPWDRIVKVLDDDPAFDLVVMGTMGRTGLSRLLLGSMTEKVIRHSPCSVLAVRASEGDRPFARVLCPVDFAEHSKRAVRIAGALAGREHDAEVTLMHVVEVPTHYASEPFLTDYMHSIDGLAKELLAAAAKELGEQHVKSTTALEVGSPVPRILAALDAKQPPFDLVVVGSHGRTGLARVLLGSVAEKLVRHANTPVLVARPRG